MSELTKNSNVPAASGQVPMRGQPPLPFGEYVAKVVQLNLSGLPLGPITLIALDVVLEVAEGEHRGRRVRVDIGEMPSETQKVFDRLRAIGLDTFADIEKLPWRRVRGCRGRWTVAPWPGPNVRFEVCPVKEGRISGWQYRILGPVGEKGVQP